MSSDWCDSAGEGEESLLSGDEPPLSEGDTRPAAVLRKKGDDVLTEVEAMERLVDCDECGDDSPLLKSDVSRFTEEASARLSCC